VPQRTILVAEDDPAFRTEVGRFLTRHGYRVLCAGDGYQAVEVARKEIPDVLILDVHMPAGDGFSVHERLGRHPELAMKPIIYMTHDPSRKIELDAYEDGAYSLLHKPFELEELLEAVRQALGASGQSTDGEADAA
jgi:DNA-binding response OmpR family regulator